MPITTHYRNDINHGSEAYLIKAVRKFIATDVECRYYYEVSFVRTMPGLWLNDAKIWVYGQCDGARVLLAELFVMNVMGLNVYDVVTDDTTCPLVQVPSVVGLSCPTVLLSYTKVGDDIEVVASTSGRYNVVAYPPLSEPITIGEVDLTSGTATIPYYDATYRFTLISDINGHYYNDLDCSYLMGVSITTTTTTTTTSTTVCPNFELLYTPISDTTILWEGLSGPYNIQFVDEFGEVQNHKCISIKANYSIASMTS